ncbi:MAG: hypothetical protein ABI051_17140 [Vicinamibacterales bacterium]
MSREIQVRDAVDRFLSRIRQDMDGRLKDLADELLQVVQGDARVPRVDLERAAVELGRAAARGGTQARRDLIARVLAAIRRLDEAVGLRGVLDAVADGAMAEAGRVAVLLLEDTTLRVYRHQGFETGRLPEDLPIDASPRLAMAVQQRQPTSLINGQDGELAAPLFLRVAQGRRGLLSPLVVGHDVVAVVYAEGPERQEGDTGEPVWIEQVEVLVRHAAARLENVTSKRTVEVLTNPT